MLRHVSAPTRDFTRIRNSQIWDDELSDSAFRLLVRGQALAEVKARTTTVTELAATLTGGRITAGRARAQLARAGLLHQVRWRGRNGQVRSESLLCDEPLSEAEADRLFATHFAEPEDRAHDDTDPPDAGRQAPGAPAAPSPGTDLPSGERLGEEKTSPLPVPPSAEQAEAQRVLLTLRRTDPRLLLGASEVRRLTPLAAEWLARDVSSDSLRHALTAGLPAAVKSPYALLRHRLLDKLPTAPETLPHALPLVTCTGCELPFRPLTGEPACRSCRQAAAEAGLDPAGASRAFSSASLGKSWRERVSAIVAGTAEP